VSAAAGMKSEFVARLETNSPIGGGGGEDQLNYHLSSAAVLASLCLLFTHNKVISIECVPAVVC